MHTFLGQVPSEGWIDVARKGAKMKNSRRKELHAGTNRTADWKMRLKFKRECYNSLRLLVLS
jgi:3'-phosphoadenosine 5'-phosphosulfate sulfotransferase